jgi:autotransporter passenger strand-loop-strand repeat protein
VLQITENGTTYSLQLNSSISSFQLAPDANFGTEVLIGPVTTISAGHSSAGTVASGIFEDVFGTANGTVINTGGSQFVYSGGLASNVTIDAFDGFQAIFSGGTAVKTTDNGSQSIYAGALALSTTMSDSTQNIFSGGTAINTFGNEATQEIFSGGTSISATFTSDTTQRVFGVASNTVLSASTQTVESGGTAIGTVLGPGLLFGFEIKSSTQDVEGVAISTTVLSNSELELDGGTASNVVINSGGVLTNFGTLTGSVVDNGAVAFDAEGNTSFAAQRGDDRDATGKHILRSVDEDAGADRRSAGKSLRAVVASNTGAASGPAGEHQFIAGGKDRVNREAAGGNDLEASVTKTVLQNDCIAGGTTRENDLKAAAKNARGTDRGIQHQTAGTDVFRSADTDGYETRDDAAADDIQRAARRHEI